MMDQSNSKADVTATAMDTQTSSMTAAKCKPVIPTATHVANISSDMTDTTSAAVALTSAASTAGIPLGWNCTGDCGGSAAKPGGSTTAVVVGDVWIVWTGLDSAVVVTVVAIGVTVVICGGGDEGGGGSGGTLATTGMEGEGI